MTSKKPSARSASRATPSAAKSRAAKTPVGSEKPFDPHLLTRARTQWQFGDWQSLAKLADDPDHLAHHPQRAELRILATAGALQSQAEPDAAVAKAQLKLSMEEGASREAVARMLIAGVYNSLGRAGAVAGWQQTKVLHQFEQGQRIGLPGVPTEFITMPSAVRQLGELQTKVRLEQISLTQSPEDHQSKLVSSFTAPSNEVVSRWAEECLMAPDIHEAVDAFRHKRLKLLDPDEKLSFFLELAYGLATYRKDRMAALSYLQYAIRELTQWTPRRGASMVAALAEVGAANLAAELISKLAILGVGPIELGEEHRTAIQKSLEAIHQSANKKGEHGHDLLLSFMGKQIKHYRTKLGGRRPLLVEIGTTREDVPGQGSTRKIALFCRQQDIDFITVDMDPHNSLMATEMFAQLGVEHFQAITSKGEDYLRDYQGELDFVFLDAYDFDHGTHSELRQTRYERFLGSRIDEAQCHAMHLDCAQSILAKLSSSGVVCIDDTWLENGKWVAKGTLAMPFLLNNGFELLEARNRAALLRRHNQADC